MLLALVLSGCVDEKKYFQPVLGRDHQDNSNRDNQPCSDAHLKAYQRDIRPLRRPVIIIGEKESDAHFELDEREMRVIGFDEHVEEYINYSVYYGDRLTSTFDKSGTVQTTKVHTRAIICFKRNLIAVKRTTVNERRRGDLAESDSEIHFYQYTTRAPDVDTQQDLASRRTIAIRQTFED